MNMPILTTQNINIVHKLPIVETFSQLNGNGTVVKLDIHDDGITNVFAIHTNFVNIGWTDSATDAFNFLNNVGLFSTKELVLAARGHQS